LLRFCFGLRCLFAELLGFGDDVVAGLPGEFAHPGFEPVLIVARFAADEFGVAELALHFGRDDVGAGDAAGFGLPAADGDCPAPAVKAERGVKLGVRNGKYFAVKRTVAVADALVVGGAVLPVGVAVGHLLEFGELPGPVCQAGFGAKDGGCLPVSEPGDALLVENLVGLLAPVAEALPFFERLGKVFLDGCVDLVVGDDGGCKSLQPVEPCGVLVSPAEVKLFRFARFAVGCSEVVALWFVAIDPALDAGSAAFPGVG